MSHYMEVKDSDYNVLREVIELLNKIKVKLTQEYHASNK